MLQKVDVAFTFLKNVTVFLILTPGLTIFIYLLLLLLLLLLFNLFIYLFVNIVSMHARRSIIEKRR